MLMPVTGIFFNRGWTIIRFTRKMLATCDTPVMLVRHPSSDPNRGVGLATAGAILLPLDSDSRNRPTRSVPSSRVALMMGSPESPDFQNPGTTALAWDNNQRTANAARRAVYHHPDDDPTEGRRTSTTPGSRDDYPRYQRVRQGLAEETLTATPTHSTGVPTYY